MKVLLINHFPLRDSESGIYTLNIAKELVKKGHKVHVIDFDNIFVEEEYNFQHSRILCNKFENPSAHLDFNFPCFTSHSRSLQTFYDLDDFQISEYISELNNEVKMVCRKFKPDVIHTQHIWIASYIANKSKIPYISTCHGTGLVGFKKDSRYHKYALIGANNANSIVAISQQIYADILDSYKALESKIKLIRSGFDQDIFKILELDKNAVLEQFKIESSNGKIVSFVGKSTNPKENDMFLKTISLVTKAIPNVKFLFIGNKDLMPTIAKTHSENKLNNIFFLENLSQQDISKLHNISDISVIPTGVKNSDQIAIESLACGTPVIASNTIDLQDIINTSFGALVESINPTAFANAIIKELKDNTKQSKGKQAAEYALEKYSWNNSTNEVIELYKQALNK